MSNRVSFAVEADSISLRSIYKKDFLELQMRAISTANPNLNGSWFTRESLELSMDSFKNKPVLGYFNTDGDFESHNGSWRRDVETGLDYWDTTNGEQVLGIIRENDDIKIVDDGDISWLCLSCALWTQYNFKQVKRLIKDAKRAKETGGTTKNISVEIDIINGEKQDNGVYRIDEFKLVGITILGSRKGKPVMPGIEDAALSIPEIIGTDFYAKQQNAIRAAYARLDNSADGEKEDTLKMTELEQSREDEAVRCAGEGDVCPDCGQDPCVCSHESEECGSEHECGNGFEDDSKACEACDQEHNECGSDDEDVEHNACGDEEAAEHNACGEDGDGEKAAEQNECGANREDESACEDKEPEEQFAAANGTPDEVHDVSWLMQGMVYGFDELRGTISYYENFAKDDPENYPNAQYIVSVLRRVLSAEMQIQGTLGSLVNKIAGEITDADVANENLYAKYSNMEDLVLQYEQELQSNKELSASIEKAKAENIELTNQIATFHLNEFLSQASSLIKSSGISESDGAMLYAKCQDGSIDNYDSLKKEVALIVFDATQQSNTHEAASLQSPVIAPSVSSKFEAKAEQGGKRDSWAIMREYYGRK